GCCRPGAQDDARRRGRRARGHDRHGAPPRGARRAVPPRQGRGVRPRREDRDRGRSRAGCAGGAATRRRAAGRGARARRGGGRAFRRVPRRVTVRRRSAIRCHVPARPPLARGLFSGPINRYDPRGNAVGAEVTPVPTGPRMTVALLDTVLERVPVGVLVVDADLRVVRANAALCGLAGGDEAALAGRPLADVAPWIPEADARRVLEGRAAEEIEIADADRPGRLVVNLQPLAGGDGAPALACMVRDVGELVAWRRGMGG